MKKNSNLFSASEVETEEEPILQAKEAPKVAERVKTPTLTKTATPAKRTYFRQPSAMEIAEGKADYLVVAQDVTTMFDHLPGMRVRIIEVGIDCKYYKPENARPGAQWQLEILTREGDYELEAKTDWFNRNIVTLTAKFNGAMSQANDVIEMCGVSFGDAFEALAPNKNRLRTQRGLWELCKGDITKYENIQKHIKASYAMATDGIIKSDEFEKAHERLGGDFEGLKSGMLYYGVIAKSLDGYLLQYREEGV